MIPLKNRFFILGNQYDTGKMYIKSSGILAPRQELSSLLVFREARLFTTPPLIQCGHDDTMVLSAGILFQCGDTADGMNCIQVTGGQCAVAQGIAG